MVNGRKYDHTTSILRDLHWLSVDQRIAFKNLMFTYKAHRTYSTPVDPLSSEISVVSLSNLEIYGDRAVSVCAPKLWNTLLIEMRNFII